MVPWGSSGLWAPWEWLEDGPPWHLHCCTQERTTAPRSGPGRTLQPSSRQRATACRERESSEGTFVTKSKEWYSVTHLKVSEAETQGYGSRLLPDLCKAITPGAVAATCVIITPYPNFSQRLTCREDTDFSHISNQLKTLWSHTAEKCLLNKTCFLKSELSNCPC